ncbi:TauD/TfdA family dioxygenase [Chitinophaga pinensis]|uniref:Taurine catabolism dioxygenase TauD/TfdA n=1 Tax=Chitinophaga pinensis (strain ATCC 43595 / DSM 2588 / LMG 13176 / NBRC 15968 / NCIMB 11800 / UQM 2034) TaxID=485918 RepID=A0A979G4U1_CHIPD|nr:TauD/TfdA family dioxygenase [Chitinophaga pinensis]ACU60869.1 Taurine catabolism dioxygenase TauD/TfdA [Chitinophaga pinensis DSM 2588]
MEISSRHIGRTPTIDEGTFPLTIRFDGASVEDFIAWYKSNRDWLDSNLLKSGAILVQGMDIDSVDKFEYITGSLGSKFRDYLDGSYPRRNLKGHVYISTEYDSSYNITMHNELSYSAKWPTRLIFGCVIPPGTGGETPLVDSRTIIDVMPAEILEEFERKQLRYIRNLHAGQGMGPSWKDTFGTDDKAVVEQHCRSIDIQYEWKKNDGLRLINLRPATRIHPVTGEKVWFNQADQYHPTHFPEEVYKTLMRMSAGVEEDLPLFVSFGDGSKIPESTIHEIIRVIDTVTVVRPWEKGDFVIVENMLVAHGRKAYTGDRKIVVSMVE